MTSDELGERVRAIFDQDRDGEADGVDPSPGGGSGSVEPVFGSTEARSDADLAPVSGQDPSASDAGSPPGDPPPPTRPTAEPGGEPNPAAGTTEPADPASAGTEAPPVVTLPAAEAAAALVGDAAGGPKDPASDELPRVFAVANQKGGVGKTTTAINLGASLAEAGYRVLIIDLDPQGNASTGLGINIRDLQGSMYDVILNDTAMEDCIEASSIRNLFVAPASLELAGAEIELVPAFSREQRVKQALDEVVDDYDFVFIDCPPSLGLLTVNGLTAAREVMVPIQCEYYALEGLGQLVKNVNLVQRSLNRSLVVSTIVLVMYDARTKLADHVAAEVREHFGDRVCHQLIPRTVRLSEAPSFGQPIIAFDPSSRGAIAYRELAKEVSRGAPSRAG